MRGAARKGGSYRDMLEGAGCGASKGVLTVAAAGAAHRTVPMVAAKGPSALGAREESSDPQAG